MIKENIYDLINYPKFRNLVNNNPYVHAIFTRSLANLEHDTVVDFLIDALVFMVNENNRRDNEKTN